MTEKPPARAEKCPECEHTSHPSGACQWQAYSVYTSPGEVRCKCQTGNGRPFLHSSPPVTAPRCSDAACTITEPHGHVIVGAPPPSGERMNEAAFRLAVGDARKRGNPEPLIVECRRARTDEDYWQSVAAGKDAELVGQSADLSALRQRLMNVKRLLLQQAYNEALAELEGR